MSDAPSPVSDRSRIDVLAADWSAPHGVHALTTLRGGPAEGPDTGFDLSHRAPPGNRQRLTRELGLPAAPVWLRQVHGTAVRDADADGGGVAAGADAAVTGRPGRVLAVLTADCLPVTFCHPASGRLGIAHAGWRGLAAGVLEATVAAMQVPAAGTLAWLGPAIGPRHFEVGDEVRTAFLAVDERCEAAFVASRAGHWLADLYCLARRRLAAAGVTRVSGGGECTFGDAGRYFSFRRDRAGARMATLLWRDALSPPQHA